MRRGWRNVCAVFIFAAFLIPLCSCFGTVPASPAPTPKDNISSTPTAVSNSIVSSSTPQETQNSVKRTITGQIVFVSQYGSYAGNDPFDRSGRHCQISIINPDGSSLEKIFDTKYQISLASSSPDGTKLAYVQQPSYGEICFVNSDGTNPTQTGNVAAVIWI